MSRPTVRFLLRSADAPGGVARSVLAVAGELARTHDVEVLSVFQRRNTPVFPVPDGVRLSYLQDHRRSATEAPPSGRWWHRLLTGPLRRRRSRLIHPSDTLYEHCTLLTDLALLRALRSMRSGVLVTTRPSLLSAATRVAPRGLALVGQEHMNAATRPSALRGLVRRAGGRARALAVLTERDRQDWVEELGGQALPVEVIPNPVPWPVGDEGNERRRVVVAAGRLTRQKGFDRLIEAYPAVAERHPDWRVHIYGEGQERRDLEQLITRSGLTGVVELRGWTGRMADVLSEAAVFALTSRFEGLPMVLLEAFGRGVPVVAFDCPRGPRELVADGVNGFLVDDGDEAAFAETLSRVLADDALRAKLSRGALETAGAYSLDSVGDRWRALLDRVTAPVGRRPA